MIRLFCSIVGHRKNKNAVDKADQYHIHQGRKVMKCTTAGWDLEVEWKDGTTSWLPSKEVKATNQVEVAEYAVANHIDTEPTFDWWVQQTLQRRRRLIKLSQKTAIRGGWRLAYEYQQP